jgi:hypothetical protein
MAQWKPDQESYLRELSKTCETLSIRYKQEYDRFKKLEAKFQLPAVVISETLGVAAFGNSQFTGACLCLESLMVATWVLAPHCRKKSYM